MTGSVVHEVPLRVGVALGAGSAAAMAQIGALEVLGEAGIPLHCIAGTSAGALVGAAHAAGRLAEFREAMAGLSRRRVLRLFDLAWPREGLLRGRRALEFVRPHLGDRIEELAIPFAAVATDLLCGDEVTLTRGSVFDAVRASIAIPGIFTPWRVDGRLLVDGGLVNPVPVSTARALGAEFVIALNVLPLRGPRDPDRLVHAHLQRVHEENDAALDDKLGLIEIVWYASRILAAQIASSRLRRPTGLPDAAPRARSRRVRVPSHGRARRARAAQRREALPDLRAALAGAVPLRRRLRGWPRRAVAWLQMPRPA